MYNIFMEVSTVGSVNSVSVQNGCQS